MHLTEVLRRPLITEKTTAILQPHNKYAFEVAVGANSAMVKAAVELMFKVKVLDVNVMNVKGKKKRIGALPHITPTWKKAIVTLRKGDKIEFFENV